MMIAESEACTFLAPVFDYLSQFHSLSDGFKAEHEEHCQLISVKKHQYIHSPLDNNNAVYFLIKGLVRGFLREGKRDISTWFGFENELLSAIGKLEPGYRYCIEYLQALEACQLIRILIALIERLNQHYPEALQLSRKPVALNCLIAFRKNDTGKNSKRYGKI